jgi:hypothetical protein
LRETYFGRLLAERDHPDRAVKQQTLPTALEGLWRGY